MTVFTILNDAELEVKRHPEQVVKNVHEAMIGVGMHYRQSRDFSIGNFSSPMKAVSAQHADTPQLVLAYQNDLVRLGYVSNIKEVSNLEYRKRLLQVAKHVLAMEEEMIQELERQQSK